MRNSSQFVVGALIVFLLAFAGGCQLSPSQKYAAVESAKIATEQSYVALLDSGYKPSKSESEKVIALSLRIDSLMAKAYAYLEANNGELALPSIEEARRLATELKRQIDARLSEIKNRKGDSG